MHFLYNKLLIKIKELSLKQSIELIKILTISQIKSRYRKTTLGFLWVILSPILTFVVQALIFKNILKINIENYYLFLLSGIVPWIFFTSSIMMTVSYFVSHRSLLMAFKVPTWALPLTVIFDNFINYIISFLFLLIIVDHSSILNNWYQIPLLFLTSFIILLSTIMFCILFATLNTFLRDIQFIMSFAINLLYFITPIFYPINLIPEKYHFLINWNPIYLSIKPFQSLLLENNIEHFFNDLKISLFVMITISIITSIIWKKYKYELYFKL